LCFVPLAHAGDAFSTYIGLLDVLAALWPPRSALREPVQVPLVIWHSRCAPVFHVVYQAIELPSAAVEPIDRTVTDCAATSSGLDFAWPLVLALVRLNFSNAHRA
jgi:hypothetical protein